MNRHDEHSRTAEQSSELSPSHAQQFATTHWSVVLAAGQEITPQSSEALNRLCGLYWYPLFAFCRRRGYEPFDAQDLTQSFFVHLLEGNRLQKVSPGKGKFRSFLIASLKNFLANDWDKRQTLKRGANLSFLPLDAEVGETRYRREPSHSATPDKAFEQSWALTLLETVLSQLREEYNGEDKTRLFEALQGYLSGDKSGVSYAEMAARLSLTEGSVKMAVLRMRRRFGELLRAEIAHTVSKPEEIDEEIRCLFAAVGA